ncbi:MAG: homocysteine S-methyltransferase family protein [Spirochaetes bacterium]|nr:homocysteine S-methyltransferase family protein [Spirochaetota bacterium]MBN2769807.1 homocysteine S-methyltransferase family protein [Spirochaetota bacterium]
MNILNQLLNNNGILILDGATGTELSERGMPSGVSPELWVLENPSSIRSVQDDYFNAGSDIVYSCTFGGNRIKLAQYTDDLSAVFDINRKLAAISKENSSGGLVFGDMAPTGKFIEPFGELAFSEAVDVYREQAAGLCAGGVDGIVIETMMDLQETRAALLGAKEAAGERPVVVTMTFDADGYTLNGTHILSALSIIQSLGADAFGCNCSTGPAEMLELIKIISPYSRIPLMAKPNAGLPKLIDGKTVFTMGAEEFSSYSRQFIDAGVSIIGGCCGTTPGHIEKVKQALDNYKPSARSEKKSFVIGTVKDAQVSSADDPLLLINTESGDKYRKCSADELRDSLVEFCIHNSYIPVIRYDNEANLSVTLNIYPGRALIAVKNQNEFQTVLPLANKFGAVIFADGFSPENGSDSECLTDIIVCCNDIKNENYIYAFNLSAIEHENDRLFEISMLYKNEIPVLAGNPSDDLCDFIVAYDALTGRDKKLENLMSRLHQSESKPASDSDVEDKDPVYMAVLKGRDNVIENAINDSLKNGTAPGKIVDEYLIPAINVVGDLYEKKEYFLPQLIMSADTMRKGFQILEPLLAAENSSKSKDGLVVIATVKGDIHDIGKNIVALMLRNYNFDVIDLGKDIDDKTIVDAAIANKADIIALSALMTTTMVQMKTVVETAVKAGCKARIIIGGAVVDQNYCNEIGADGYSSDAMEAVKLAQRLIQV